MIKLLESGSILNYQIHEQYERFKYYSKPEEILLFLRENYIVDETYKESQLYDDLKQLEAWECVISRQDKELVYTIEEFKNKRLKYQISQPLFEIENTLKKIDDLQEELTGALESREFERILKGVNQLYQINLEETDDEILYEKWMTLMKSLENLKRNSANYLSHLKSEKAEQLFKTEEFFIYKEKFVDYLTKFILTMNRNKYKIAKTIDNIEEGFVNRYIERLVGYIASIPTLDGKEFDWERSTRIQMERWIELKNWFVKSNDNDCDVEILLRETEISIQTMSRHALRLSEIKGNNQNRKKDYQTLASMFYACEEIGDAHKLSAACFGVAHTKHIYGEEKLTDTQDEEIWEQNQSTFATTPRGAGYQRTKRIKSYVKASEEERQKQVEDYIKNREKQREIIEALIVDNKIVLKNLGVVDSFVRKSILTWINRGVQSSSRTGKTDFGVTFRFNIASNKKIKLRCDDGEMEMPDLVFEFGKGE
ncbi:TIGR02677 family protein [Bacillus litorisediminis]|uniref:TIGR02677 family protein n=1 Tax=Bacillus litorisediminis TaxID=2922713 RepID=UPI001FADDA7D|nr:TIGR02677 family protein [Bacillus litorisediminis]